MFVLPLLVGVELAGARGACGLKEQRTPRDYLMPHILLVEDTETVADALREVLEAEGWQVQMCADGLAALRLIQSRTHYDLLLLDNELPRLNGLELTSYARGLEHRKGTPIVMISASEYSRDARLVGVNVFLSKPGEMGKIIETVRRLLNAA